MNQPFSSFGGKSLSQLRDFFEAHHNNRFELERLLEELQQREDRCLAAGKPIKARLADLLRKVRKRVERLCRRRPLAPHPGLPIYPVLSPPSSSPNQPPSVSKEPVKMPRYLEEWHRLISRFNNLLRSIILPAGTPEAEASRDRALENLKRLGEEIEDWKRRYPPDCFPWPTTDLLGRGGEFNGERAPLSPLCALGYHTGKTSELTQPARRTLLDYAFTNILPPVNGSAYMEAWGEPASAGRLQRMANHIATLARSGKGRTDGRLAVAIAEWSEDLAYLKVRFYQGYFGFDWP